MITASITGRLRTWYGDVGDFVDSDEIIAEIETADGTQVQVVAPAAGRITEISHTGRRAGGTRWVAGAH